MGGSGTTGLNAVLLPGNHGSAADALSEAVRGMLKHATEAISDSFSPIVGRLLDRLQTDLKLCPDYDILSVRRCVDAVLIGLVSFLNYRMDVTKGHDPGSRYLFEPSDHIRSAPKQSDADGGNEKSGKQSHQRDHFERELQNDCMARLFAMYQDEVTLERSNVASGRADIMVKMYGIKIVIEVKREDNDASHQALCMSYGKQATEYSNTNARIGFLLVLDRSRTDGSAGHISQHVSVATVCKQGVEDSRTLVIMTMPGRRKTPSQLS